MQHLNPSEAALLGLERRLNESYLMFSRRSLWSPAALSPLPQQPLISAELLGMVICWRWCVCGGGFSQCECGVLADLVVTSLNFAH